eukprot:6207595-Pleurochrysis_carterae.AAC.2
MSLIVTTACTHSCAADSNKKQDNKHECCRGRDADRRSGLKLATSSSARGLSQHRISDDHRVSEYDRACSGRMVLD